MKKLRWWLIVFVVCVVGVGFVRGWFVLSSPGRDAGSHKIDVNLAVDPDKIKEDGQKVKDKTRELTGQAKE